MLAHMKLKHDWVYGTPKAPATKPHLRLHVHRGAASGTLYWRVTHKTCGDNCGCLHKWQHTDWAALMQARFLFGQHTTGV